MVRSRSTLLRSLTLAAAAAAAPGQLHAVGFRMPNQDPEGIARGNAFAATADNPSAIFYNPAGITQLEGHQFSLGIYAISPDVRYTSPLNGAMAETDTTFQYIPQVYYTFSPKDSPWSYGLGVYAPYGLGANYGNISPISTFAQEAELAYLTASPVVAYQLSPTLSVAGGLTFNYADVRLERQVGLLPGGDGFRFDGDGYDTGFTLGALWHPVEKWSFGLNYRSATNINFEGKSIVFPFSGYQATSGALDFPQNIVAGVSFRPDDKWNFEFNVDWTDWDVVNDALFVGTFPANQIFPFRYESGFMYNFGVTRQLGKGYFVSAGYIFSENSVPDLTLTPFNPDDDLHLASIGFGHRGETVSWALGYHFATNGGGRNVVGNGGVSPLPQTANGKYEIFNNAVNISVRYSF